MKAICIIPSRIQSTRLPRKPLLPINGKPMIQWVYENAKLCAHFSEVIVATDSLEIETLITHIGGKAILTDPHIATGSDRVATIAPLYPNADIIVNLQGDEPFLKAAMMDKLLTPYLQGLTPEAATLAFPLAFEKYNDPAIVKVILNLKNHALYFSRSPIPYYRTEHKAPVYHHMGIYAFRRDFLLQYTHLAQTPLEKTESLEQLRILEHGYSIYVSITQEKTLEVNTEEEYIKANQLALHFQKNLSDYPC